jgi:putative DNA primase/helicase
MSVAEETQFSEWKERAVAVGLLATAKLFNAKLRKAGQEYIGPCCNCGGTDRLAIHVTKNKWHCRGHGGGESPITLAMHLGNLSWKEAAERLAGPCPSGPAKPLSEAELAERNRRRVENERAQEARKAQEAAQDQDTREFCAGIWNECIPIECTLAEKYLHLFHLPTPPDGWPPVLGFHPALQYPGKGKMPALVARVDDVSGELTGIWREFIRADGRKADVPQQKLALGPVAGGAVRLGGMNKRIGVCEGLRTGLGAWALINFKYPIWPCMSTSGLIGFEVPLGVESLVIYPDGDRPIKKHGHEFVPTVPAGRKAAEALRARALREGVAVTIAQEPPPLLDYEKLWQAHAREVA